MKITSELFRCYVNTSTAEYRSKTLIVRGNIRATRKDPAAPRWCKCVQVGNNYGENAKEYG